MNLETERLLLRRWEPDDLKPFAAINADPEVMEHLLPRLSRAETATMIEAFDERFERDGFGFWALELREEGELIGFTGLRRVPEAMPFAPAVEVGWRLARSRWGAGLASEAARASIDWGFRELDLDEIVAYTTPGNVRSWSLMERLGMTRDPDGDFPHPGIPPGDPRSGHILYRLKGP
jgi:RimJ/RimL family protein N-acetyltransferase